MAIALHSTALGVFAFRAEAEQAVRGLLEVEFKADQVGIVLSDAAGLAAGSEDAGPVELWAGAMFRSLIGATISESELSYYEEALEEGRTLVMVRAGDRYPEAMDILFRCGGKYMEPF